MNCTNCGHKLSCGCQQRTASDGKKVCSNCLSAYEANLVALNPNLTEHNKNAQNYIWNIPNNYYPKK